MASSTVADSIHFGVPSDPLAATRFIYLDNNATTRALPEVREAVAHALDGGFGNPSSAHSTGEQARQKLFEARQAVAELIGAFPEQVFFTSGATEANNIVLKSAALRDPARGIVTTRIEHSSVLTCCQHLEDRGVPMTYLTPSPSGRIEPEVVEAAVQLRRPGLVAVQWVNNETGVIQPIAQIAEICRRYGAELLCDAAQAVGKIPIALNTIAIDYLTMTGHKFHGPPGAGALVTRAPQRLSPLLHGGDQELGLRPGTENFPGIVGLGVAARLRKKRINTLTQIIGGLRDRFERALIERFPFIRVNGDPVNRVFTTTNLCFTGIDGQALVARLDADQVRCSQSSACTNARPEPSYVLRAMDLSERDAFSSVRFAFSELNSTDDVDVALERLSRNIEVLSAILA